MPRVKMLRNLGKADLDKFELDPRIAKEGALVDIDTDTYEELIRRSLVADAGPTADAAPEKAPKNGPPVK